MANYVGAILFPDREVRVCCCAGKREAEARTIFYINYMKSFGINVSHWQIHVSLSRKHSERLEYSLNGVFE